VVLEHGEGVAGDEELVASGLDAFELVLDVVDGAADLFEGSVGVLGGDNGIRLLRFDLLEL
jgi:hypothetical protein